MIRVAIEEGYRLTVPKALRRKLKIGDEMFVRVDRAGRIVLISEKRIRATLSQTAGMWRGREDVPNTGIKYVNKIRRGQRLRRLGVVSRASD